jgi:3'-5' exoribonuclease
MPPEGSIALARAGQPLIGVFACTRKDRLVSRTGSPYLALELRDASGTLPARVFRDADRLAGTFERGDVVRVRGSVERFRDALVAELTEVVRVEPGEPGVDPAAFLPRAYRDLDELDGFLEHLAGEVHDRPYAALLERVLGDGEVRAGLRRSPCTRSGHHAYLGGLLEHTVAVTQLAYEACQLHGRLNSDLLLTAAVLHDIGRIREFELGAEIGISEEGRLLGHLVIGERLVTGFATGLLESERLLPLLHCVLSHHGPGSAPGGRFASAEALALYRVNALDADVKGALEHGLDWRTAAR